MNGVRFNSYHSFDDLNIILSSKSIGAPTPKTNIVEVPGADGALDFTEFFGEVKYKNRTLTFNFSMIGTGSYQLSQYSYIKNLLHGRRMKIVLDADPMFYYVGRLTVGNLSSKKNINTFSVTCDCEPYKYKINKTIVSNVTTVKPQTLIFLNSRKSVVPTIEITGNVQFTFNGITYTYKTGIYVDDEIIFKSGNNVFTNVFGIGKGKITVEYQEASL